MAKSKFKTVDMSDEAVQEREMKLEEKRSKKQVEKELEVETMPTDSTTPQITEAPTQKITEEVQAEQASAKVPKARGMKYTAARAQVDKTKIYPLSEGIDLLKKIKFTKFDESLEVHFVLKEVTPSVEVKYPHATGKVIRVAVLDDDIISNLEKGLTDFDILLASPAQMGKITKFARLLGPKGLMPNPKNGTLVSDTTKRKAELEAGKIAVKGEKKAPLMHATVGKISLPTKDLAENLETLVKALGMGKVLKATICTSMSPGIRVSV